MDELIRINNATLDALPAAIERPHYDRRRLQPGILHIGPGNFHRAHQAWYLHRLMQAGHCHDWAIIGAGVCAEDARRRERLRAQDWLTTLISLDPAGITAEVTGAMIGFAPPAVDNGALIRQLADPRIRLVTLTVTEGGYYRDPAAGGFDEGHPDIRHDAANPDRPRTAFGAMAAALRMRRDRGSGPFTAMSCDNLVGNGRILRQTILSLAQLSDPGLADWIGRNCSFPNAMVDCIVPATGAREIALARDLGIDDRLPVAHENYRQWVIADDFCAGRPPWDEVGAIFSDRVHDYEAMKLRILNAGHQLIANVGELLSLATIADCMAHPPVRAFFRKVQTNEILPHVGAVPGMAPPAYLDLVERRFANNAIADTVRRVAFDGSSRHTGFLLPVLRDGLKAGTAVAGLALAEAFWARMCAGNREDGSSIAPNDPCWEQLCRAADSARDEPHVWLAQRQFYGDLIDAAPFCEVFARWLALIWSEGADAALRAYLQD